MRKDKGYRYVTLADKNKLRENLKLLGMRVTEINYIEEILAKEMEWFNARKGEEEEES